ncbi:MAG: baseplate J/gp47 family protein [Pseudoflavonifractor sp.]
MKTIEEIYAQMAATFTRETGQTVGQSGDLAARLYAVAAQIYSLSIQGGWVGRQGFPQTADGAFLDRHAGLRGLTRRAAARAEGRIRFSVAAAVTAELFIPQGTVCMTAGQVRFETSHSATLPAGSTAVEVSARAAAAGTAGNVAAGSILTMAVAPVGITACTNPAAFAGGVEAEDDEGLRGRILETFRRLPNGANAAFYEQGALSFPEVVAAAVLAKNRGIGTVDVVVSTRSGSPDGALLAKLKDYFQTRREIAVDVGVLPPTLRTVNLNLAITPREGTSFGEAKAAAEAAIRGYFDGTLLGKNLLRAQLGALVFGAEGVGNYSMSAPAADVKISAGELPQLGTLTITELGA